MRKKFKFIDLFAGIGGFHMAFHNLKAKCVFASEWDKDARNTYETNFRPISKELFKKNNFVGDITQIDIAKIPDFDLLCAGFPCQPFSQAGYKKGFNEIRGTLFFDIVKILKEKQPSAFFLENVRHLFNHQNGHTFLVMKRIIEKELNYSFHYKIIKASDFGLPQHRPRLFMVGFKDKAVSFKFPDTVPLKFTMSDVLGGNCQKKIGYTIRVGGRSSGINDRRNWDSYIVDNEIKQIGVEEAKKMQGFPSSFIFPVSKTQALKQLGNSVAVPAIQAVGKEILNSLRNNYVKSKQRRVG